MKDLINKVTQGDCLQVMKQIPDNSIDLIIADPPYFKIKGEFDWKWEKFEDYLKDVGLWAVECKRVLKENGTLFWFGDEKNIAYTQIIFDKYFGLLNNLVWWKYDLRGGAFGSSGGELIRCFPICTERILMYSIEEKEEELVLECGTPFLEYMTKEKEKLGWNIKKINSFLGYSAIAGHWFYTNKEKIKNQLRIITEKDYKKLQTTGFFQKPYKDLRKEYEELRKKYEKLRRPFNNIKNLTEVLQFNSNKLTSFEHDTIKPIELIQNLVLTCSNKNDLILDPFLGSGTTAVACQNLKRNFIGIEIDKKYCEIARQRLRQKPLL